MHSPKLCIKLCPQFCTRIWLTLILLLLIPASANASAVLASGAGYRSLVDALTEAYTAETGHNIERVYGNMARVTTQAKISGAVDMVLGDATFLTKAKLDFAHTTLVGMGRLAIAFPSGSNYSSAENLLSASVTRIAIPDTARAIYGKAALQYLKSTKTYDRVQDKLLIVSTVPQAASYVLAHEVDYAFINLTHAKKLGKALGGYALADEAAYSPIRIILGQIKDAPHQDECAAFMNFLTTPKARNIISTHGL